MSKIEARVTAAVGASGVLLLFASLTLPWFQEPDSKPGDGSVIVAREAPATLAFSILCLVALTVLLRLLSSKKRRRQAAAKVAAALLASLLFYPHAVMIWCPATSARATALLDQHLSLSSSAGDTFISDENKTTGWKDRVYVADLLQKAAVVRTPSWSPDAVPFGRPHDLFEWFGYSNAFCFFVAPGWALALLGSLLLLIGLCRAPRGLDLSCAAGAGRVGVACFAALGLLFLLPAAVCAFQVERARGAAEQGLLSLSLARLQQAARLLPVISRNGDYVQQVGNLESRLGMQTAEAELHRATILQRQGEFDAADTLFLSLLAPAGSAGDAIHEEAARGLLRQGIRSLNSGEVASAIVALETVLRAEPTNLKASYALELAYLRASRFEAVAPLAARMRKIYHYMGTLTKVPVLGANDENLAMAAFLKGDAVAAHVAWQKLGDPKRLRKEP